MRTWSPSHRRASTTSSPDRRLVASEPLASLTVEDHEFDVHGLGGLESRRRLSTATSIVSGQAPADVKERSASDSGLVRHLLGVYERVRRCWCVARSGHRQPKRKEMIDMDGFRGTP
jgi:hypothetical protein